MLLSSRSKEAMECHDDEEEGTPWEAACAAFAPSREPGVADDECPLETRREGLLCSVWLDVSPLLALLFTSPSISFLLFFDTSDKNALEVFLPETDDDPEIVEALIDVGEETAEEPEDDTPEREENDDEAKIKHNRHSCNTDKVVNGGGNGEEAQQDDDDDDIPPTVPPVAQKSGYTVEEEALGVDLPGGPRCEGSLGLLPAASSFSFAVVLFSGGSHFLLVSMAVVSAVVIPRDPEALLFLLL